MSSLLALCQFDDFKLAGLDALKKSLLHRAINGKL
jgi:hypothetical protein